MTREKAILDFVRSRRKVGDGWVSWHDIRKHAIDPCERSGAQMYQSIMVLAKSGLIEEQGRGHGPALVRAKEAV